MPDVRYNSTTGGSTFGDPNKIFEGASRSFNRAIQGAAGAFDKLRTGNIDAKDQLTQEALTGISGINTEEGKTQLMQQLQAAGGAENLFQGTDLNKVNKALQSVDDNVYNQGQKIQGRNEAARVFGEQIATRAAGEAAQGQDIDKLAHLRDTARTPSEANVFQSQIDKLNQRETQEVQLGNARFAQEQNLKSRGLQKDITSASQNISPIIPGEGSVAEYQQVETDIAEFVATLKADKTKNYTSDQIAQITQTLKRDAGISSEEEISRVYNELPKDPKTGKVSKTDFYAAVKDSGNSATDADKFIAAVNQRTGVTSTKAEALYQQRRQEKLEDADAKNYTDAGLADFVNSTYDEGGFFTALDREEANNYAKKARTAGMPNRLIFQMLVDANDGTGDFIESTAKDIINTFKETGEVEAAKKALKNSTTDALPNASRDVQVPTEQPGEVFANSVKRKLSAAERNQRPTFVNQ